jgi:hypothetical protein
MWLLTYFVSDSFYLGKHEFKRGDYLKFGRVTFKVKETSREPIHTNLISEPKHEIIKSEGAVLAR